MFLAHPDDESFGCGSVLASAAAGGYDTAVLCATRGEAGESRVPTEHLAAVREAELRAAAKILGVGVVQLLDHTDSGMAGEPGPGTLAATEPSLIAGEVRAVIDDFRPDVIVTLDASDGHRDHVIVREATLSAVDTAKHTPAATYLWCLARSSMAAWARHAAGDRADAYLGFGELGTPTRTSPRSSTCPRTCQRDGWQYEPTRARPAHTTTCRKTCNTSSSPPTGSDSFAGPTR